jgi:hypothetical protein
MKNSKFTESQIVQSLKVHEASKEASAESGESIIAAAAGSKYDMEHGLHT